MPPKRRRKVHGLYFHSSPPKVLTMNQLRQQKTLDSGTPKDAIIIKPSNIRIWIHDKDIGKLARVLWEGQGNRLRTEVSSNNKVKKFLDAVPSIMNIIKDVHSAVVDNDIETLVAKTSPPAPVMLLTTKDANGLTPLHKAAGLAHARIVEYLLNAAPNSATEIDFTGKTPLHWAASAKNNPRSYNLLVQAGCDEQALDYKMKTPAHYKAKPNDIDRSLLTVIPEAPRVPQQGMPPGYDWNMLSEDASFPHQNNNFIRKSQSNYESYTILSDDPPPMSMMKRNLSTDELRNGNLTPTSPKPTTPKSFITKQSTVFDSDTISEPLTAEEQAVLVAIDPVNERLYARTPSNASPARADTPIPDSNANEPDDQNDENGPNRMTDIDLETGVDLQSTTETAVEASEGDDMVNGGYDNDANESTGEQDATDDEPKGNDEALFIYQRTFNPNEKAEEMYSLESEDQDTLKEDNEETENEIEDGDKIEPDELGELDKEPPEGQDTEETMAANNDDDKVENDEPDELDKESLPADTELEELEEEEEHVEGHSDDVQLEEEEQTEAVNSDENNNENELDPELIDEESANEEIKALTNDMKEDANDEENGSYKEVQGDHDDNEEDKEISPSPAMQIEGVVTGEPDDGVVQSEGGQIPIDDDDDADENNENDDETLIKNIINSGDMEQLAALVLNGKGLKLIGQTSSSPEIQAFLDNVSAYMNKIRRVHLAAREGSLRDLQSALDRRKFAVAKDDISPNGATPLHVATVFGHAGIIRYLAGRFPETMAAVDDNGRTALHYAATINDNGHFFNLLSHLGSNPKAEDKTGHSAEFYTNHEQSSSVLNHRMILKGFGAEEQLADDMLSDQALADH
ncbi:uncharacterized protein LOC119074076 isoform X3 [Bradysia coprophila]|uniref:uncharacterized protein LOC119074076 isoform X3 n=1 Tax=Bradysia coprophila TaxID=38358 RepID=UPI00187D8565|nr:uncharacterized protein LOC119074076 isoform X3 [Bradysia coprophila]